MTEQAFFQRIGSVMKDNMYDRQVVGFRSGKIANKTLYKTQIPGQTKIFSRKQERKNKEYAITILLDISGSMMNSDMGGTHRLKVASDLAKTLIKGLERNNIQFSVVAYGNQTIVVKKFDQKFKHKSFQEDMMNLCLDYGSSTKETEALQEAYRLVLTQPGKRDNRFTMIFTDGAPNDITATETELKKLNKISKIFPFGIGLDISEIHKGAMRVCNKEVFMFKTLRSLELNIKRG